MPAPTTQRVPIPYTLFKQQVDASNVAAITATADQIQGRLKQPVSFTPVGSSQAVRVTAFSTVQPTFSDPGLEALLEQQGVVVNATSLDQTTPWWLNLLLGFGPTILLIAGFVWLSNRAGQASGGGLFGIGRSRAKRYNEAQDKSKCITFDDVAGIDEAKGELVESVDFLKDPHKYTRLGGSVPRGRAVGQAARHRQDAACPGRLTCRRTWRFQAVTGGVIGLADGDEGRRSRLRQRLSGRHPLCPAARLSRASSRCALGDLSGLLPGVEPARHHRRVVVVGTGSLEFTARGYGIAVILLPPWPLPDSLVGAVFKPLR